MRTLTLLLFALLAAACESATAPTSPAFMGREPLDPPPASYRNWYGIAAACVGITNPAEVDQLYRRVEWYTADRIVYDGLPVLGLWSGPHAITIDTDMVQTRWVVIHESLHDLLQLPGHDYPVFESCKA